MSNKPKRLSPLQFMIKRNAFLFLLNGIVVFFFLAFWAFVRVNAQEIVETASHLKSLHLADFKSYTASLFFPFSAECSVMVAGGLGFFNAMVLFFHCFNKKSALLVASLPRTRNKDFSLRMLAYVVLGVVPVLISILLCFGKVFCSGIAPYTDLSLLAVKLFGFLMLHIYGFMVGVLCSTLAGQIWSAMIGGVLFTVALPLTLLIIEARLPLFFHTMVPGQITLFLKKFSPLMNLYQSQCHYEPFSILPVLLMMAVMGLASFMLYRSRQTEDAEKTLVFRRSIPILQFVVVALSAFACGAVFFEISHSKVLFAFAMVMGGAFTHVLYQFVVAQRFVTPFKRIGVSIVAILMLLVCYVGVWQDWIRYDAYLPDREDVLSITYLEKHADFSERIRITSPQTLDAVLAWAGVQRDLIGDMEDERLYTMARNTIEFTFETKNGIVKRQYYMDDKALSLPLLEKIVYSDDYKASLIHHPGLQVDMWEYMGYYPTDIPALTMENPMNQHGLYPQYESLPDQNKERITQQLQMAMIADIENRTLEAVQSSPIIAIDCKAYGPDASFSFNVYPSDTHVLNVLFGDNATAVTQWLSGGFLNDPTYHLVIIDLDKDPLAKTAKLVAREDFVSVYQASSSYNYSTYYSLPVNEGKQLLIYNDQFLKKRGLEEPFDYQKLVEKNEDSNYVASRFLQAE